ncbi:MAG: 50S ribosomal protein L18 [Candidatus Omnitrophota bacterium]
MKVARVKRHKRIRKKITGTKERPRLSIYRSLKNIYAQLIDDENSATLLTCSTQQKELKEKVKANNINAAALLGEFIAKEAKVKGIETVVFDRGGYLYHGRIKAVAEAARKGGLKF